MPFPWYVIIPLVAIVSWIIQEVCRGVAISIGLVDHPNSRKIHSKPIPLSGGIGMFLPVSIFLIVWIARGGEGMGVLAGLGVLSALGMITLTGFIDDFRPVSPSKRLLVQAMASFLLWNVGVRLDLIHFGGFALDLGLFSLPLTMLWFMGFMNTSNFMDGMDGLSGGMSLMALGSISVVGFITGSLYGPVALILAVVTAIYLIFNLSTNRKIFLGDSGSLTLGLSVGVLGILVSRVPSGVGLDWHAIALVLAAYSVGVMDVLVAIIRRARRGASVFKADKHHFHHRLLRAGLGEGWTLAALHGMAGLVLFAVSLPGYGSGWAIVQFLVPSSMVLGAGLRLLRVAMVKGSVVVPLEGEPATHANPRLSVTGNDDTDKHIKKAAGKGR